jgi:hypothetical protein
MTFSLKADKYSILKTQMASLEVELKELRDQLLDIGAEEINGKFAVITVGLSERSTIDRAKVAELLTEKQLASVTNTTVVASLRVKNLPQKGA